MKHKTTKRGSVLNGFLLLLGMLSILDTALAQQPVWIYIVTKHDTLWDLSEKYFPNVSYWKKFQQINGIKEPKLITPGTRLKVPMAWLNDQPVPAKVLSSKGEVNLISSKSTSPQPVVAGMTIQLGNRLQTGPNASASIEFADGSVVNVRQQTDLVFDHLSEYSDTGMVDTRLRLSNGRVDVRARPAAGPGSRFEIHTPAAVSAVRGTRYRTASRDTEHATWVEVLEGKVAATGSDKTALVPAAYGTRVSQGEPPLRPRPLLQAPQLYAIPAKIEQIGWPLTWEPVSGAARYHTEIAARADFSLIQWERYSDGPRTPLPDLADGSYFVRVRAIDDLGIEGLDRQHRILIDARPQPPVPLAPRDAGVSRSHTPKLSWSDSSEAQSYRLQLATDPTFTRMQLDRNRLTTTSLQTPALPLGKYYWRLASISASGEQGPFGPSRNFEIKPPPAKPEPSIGGDKEKIVASWQAGAEGQTYQVQVAKDAGFKTLLYDETIERPQVEIPQVKGMLRYLRVRVVEPDSYLGPWGAVQKIDPLPDWSWVYVILGGLLGALML